MRLEIMYLIYMYKKNLALNGRKYLICHKIKPNQSSFSEAHDFEDDDAEPFYLMLP